MRALSMCSFCKNFAECQFIDIVDGIAIYICPQCAEKTIINERKIFT